MATSKQLCVHFSSSTGAVTQIHISAKWPGTSLYKRHSSVLTLGMARDSEPCFLYASLRSLGLPPQTREMMPSIIYQQWKTPRLRPSEAPYLVSHAVAKRALELKSQGMGSNPGCVHKTSVAWVTHKFWPIFLTGNMGANTCFSRK